MTTELTRLNMKKSGEWAGFAIFALMGGFSTAYGVMVPVFRERFNLDIAQGGLIFAVAGASAFVGIALGTWSVSKIPSRIAGAWGAFSMSLGAVLIALAGSWTATLIGVVFVGLGFGSSDATISQFASNGGNAKAVKRTNILNASFAMGAVVVPLVINYGIRTNFTVVVVAISFAFFIAGFIFFKNVTGRLTHEKQREKPIGHRLVLFSLLLGIAFYVGVEAGIGGWVPTYLIEKGMTPTMGAWGVALFFSMLTLGRVFSHNITKYISPAWLSAYAQLTAVIALLMIWYTPWTFFSIALLGLVCAPVFPSVLVWAVRITPGDPRTAGFFLLAAIIGGTFSPTLMGYLMRYFGTNSLPLILIPPSLIGGLIFLWAIRQNVKEHIDAD
ncbi:MAG: MFS transporter [Candidatus Nanopelagicales bacterium]